MMQRLDTDMTEKYVSAAIYGRSGTGKTSFVVSAPSPLICLTERQGLVHVKQAAARLNKPIPPVFYCEDLGDLRNLVKAFMGDKSKPFRIRSRSPDNSASEKILFELEKWPETIGIDSFTDVCCMVTECLDRESPPRVGSDGLPTHTQNYWGALDTRCSSMIRNIRDLPVNKIFLCLADDKEIGEGAQKTRMLAPSLPMRKLAEKLCAAVNVVGYTFRTVKRKQTPEGLKTKLHYGVLTVGPDYMLTKPYRPLRDAEIPDFSYWLSVIRGDVPERPAPVAPDDLESGEEAVAAATEPPKEESSPPSEPPKAKAKKGVK